MSPKSERTAPPPRRGRRVAQGIYLALSASFIVYATWQVERQVFGPPSRENHVTEPNCSYAIGAFDEAISNGLALAAQEHTRGRSEQAFEDKVTTVLSAVQKRCTGPDVGAYVASVRLREAAEATLEAQLSTLAPLRAAIQARRNP